MPAKSRPRLPYLLCVLLLIAIGLPARLTDWYPPFVVIYVGDALWALMIYVLWVTLFPRSSPLKAFMICLIACYLVEFSQLYQADWINTVRHWPLMGLILGYGFRWEDLIAYALGIGLGFGLDSLYLRISAKRPFSTRNST